MRGSIYGKTARHDAPVLNKYFTEINLQCKLVCCSFLCSAVKHSLSELLNQDDTPTSLRRDCLHNNTARIFTKPRSKGVIVLIIPVSKAEKRGVALHSVVFFLLSFFHDSKVLYYCLVVLCRCNGIASAGLLCAPALKFQA